MASSALALPVGYSLIPECTFTPLANSSLGTAPIDVAEFGMKRTPVTNGEWAELTQSLAGDRFVLLKHNWETGATRIVHRGKTAVEAAMGPLCVGGVNFDRGESIIIGSHVLLKMVDSPSAQFGSGGRVINRVNQPVVGIAYFHGLTWCLLKNLEDNNGWFYKLPTDVQFERVASVGGTREYPTETGKISGSDGRKLAHVEERKNSGSTADVNDPRYAQRRPFDVDAVGNVWRLIQMNPVYKKPGDFFDGPYGIRAGAWTSESCFACAILRGTIYPVSIGIDIGFSPVVVRSLSGGLTVV